MQGDMEKANRLALEGWLLLTFHTDDVTGQPFEMVDTIRKAINQRAYLMADEYGLTERELEVLHCIAGGFKTKEVADRLDCAEFTVSSHVESIIAKMRATNRTHAVAMAVCQNIISGEDVPWAIEVSFD
jgi:DNA-binding CsgD family transcriptional regulator